MRGGLGGSRGVDAVEAPVAPGAAVTGQEATAEARYRATRREHWQEVARRREDQRGLGAYYRRRLAETYRTIVPPGLRVLELGCGTGDLLAALEPERGVGVDFAPGMLERARSRHPGLHFVEADAHELALDESFDAVILSDLTDDLWDVQRVLRRVARLVHPRSRIVINTFSHLWQQPLALARRAGLATPVLEQNWLTVEDLGQLLALEDFEVVKTSQQVLCPVPLWPLHTLCNRYLVRLWPFRQLALTNFVVARPSARAGVRHRSPRVSVVIPARNEAGNMSGLLGRVPEMGAGTEIVFVEGGSTDETYAAIAREVAAHPERTCQVLRQPGRGKGDAVRTGFQAARGDILMILDADLTVRPEDLDRFYDVIASGKGEFVNGVRLVYPQEDQAMRYLNLVGNKFFSLAFSWLLDQPIKDTLCGTKVLWREDYERIAANRAYFGDFDPFGDFDLIFGASRLALKIVDMPIRYHARTYGETNIRRFRHGLLLLQMVLFAARKLKFS